MGKRSDFERKDRDFYPTPYEAVVPLLPHLPETFTFAEPCAGDGALIKHIKGPGRICGWASDIEPQESGWQCIWDQDALTLGACRGDLFITNPPWKWKILTLLITHLSDIARTWLLLNADLMHNKRMAPHMERCVKVVSVGRVSWMQNGKKGFENCAWYLFDKNNTAQTEFYGRIN